MIDKIVNRLKSILARGIIHLVNDEAGRQFAQVTILAGEVRSGVERIQHFGFTSNPPAGSSSVLGFIGADRGRPVILGENDPATRLKGLKTGESAAYDAFGQYVRFCMDGTVEIKTNGTLLVKAPEKVRMETALLEVTGDIQAGGEIIDKVGSGGVSMSSMREIYNSHVHPENDGGGPTDPPNESMGD